MIRHGDVFDFEGLGDPEPEVRRVLTVAGISVTGNVQFHMTIEDPDPDETSLSGQTVIAIPLTEALAMIEQAVLIPRP